MKSLLFRRLFFFKAWTPFLVRVGGSCLACLQRHITSWGYSLAPLAGRHASRAAPAQGVTFLAGMHRTIEIYKHGSRIGAMVELECRDDFAAKTDEFRDLARHIAMHIAAADPKRVAPEKSADVFAIDSGEKTPGSSNDPEALLNQEFVTDPSLSVGEAIAKVNEELGEMIRVVRFTRYEVGET